MIVLISSFTYTNGKKINGSRHKSFCLEEIIMEHFRERFKLFERDAQ